MSMCINVHSNIIHNSQNVQSNHMSINRQIWRGTQNPQILFIKNCIFIPICWDFSPLQSTLHLMQYTYQDIFFHCSELFFNSLILMPFSASDVFCFTSSTSAKHFPLRTFFIQEKKNHSGQDWVNRERGAQRSCHFWSKTAQP